MTVNVLTVERPWLTKRRVAEMPRPTPVLWSAGVTVLTLVECWNSRAKYDIYPVVRRLERIYRECADPAVCRHPFATIRAVCQGMQPCVVHS